MVKVMLAVGLCAAALATTPSEARSHDPNASECSKWRHGVCVQSRGATRHDAYRMGYKFGPGYDYTAYSALPRTYVTRYRLEPRYRYVYQDAHIYVVDPTTYAITRILNAL